MQGQSLGRPAWFNATLDNRAVVQGGKWLIPMDLQQWPKSLPSKGTLELDVLQLPLSKVPWIAKDGSIVIGIKQMAPTTSSPPIIASLPTAADTPAAQQPSAAVVAEHDTGHNEGQDSNGIVSDAASGIQQAEIDVNSGEVAAGSRDDQTEDVLAGTTSSVIQRAPA